jgi:hypothetical protein
MRLTNVFDIETKGRLGVVKTFDPYNGLSHRLHFFFFELPGCGLLN